MILIADDNDNDAMVILETLKAAGVRNPVTLVSDGREVVKYFKGVEPYHDRTRHPLPQVLLLDLKMPQMGGFAVLEWLKATGHNKNILAVILSGFSELENIKRGYELGARSFLPKPCRLDDIKQLIGAYSSYWQLDKPASDGSQDTDKRTPLNL